MRNSKQDGVIILRHYITQLTCIKKRSRILRCRQILIFMTRKEISDKIMVLANELKEESALSSAVLNLLSVVVERGDDIEMAKIVYPFSVKYTQKLIDEHASKN
jgi:hypothetical protein